MTRPRHCSSSSSTPGPWNATRKRGRGPTRACERRSTSRWGTRPWRSATSPGPSSTTTAAWARRPAARGWTTSAATRRSTARSRSSRRSRRCRRRARATRINPRRSRGTGPRAPASAAANEQGPDESPDGNQGPEGGGGGGAEPAPARPAADRRGRGAGKQAGAPGDSPDDRLDAALDAIRDAERQAASGGISVRARRRQPQGLVSRCGGQSPGRLHHGGGRSHGDFTTEDTESTEENT